MGSAGNQGVFNKPAGPMDEGPDLNQDVPIDPDEDSDNSAIYVQGLNDNVTLDDLADFFKQCGVVKVSDSGQVIPQNVSENCMTVLLTSDGGRTCLVCIRSWV